MKTNPKKHYFNALPAVAKRYVEAWNASPPEDHRHWKLSTGPAVAVPVGGLPKGHVGVYVEHIEVKGKEVGA